MRRTMIGAIMTVVVLAGCQRMDMNGANQGNAATPGPGTSVPTSMARAPTPKPTPIDTRPVITIEPGVVKAMSAIDRPLRPAYQAAFACEVKKATAARQKTIDVTPDYVRRIVATLKPNGSLPTC